LKSNRYIQHYSHINNGKVLLDGVLLFNEDHDNFPTFIKSAYKHLETDYPKFFKMDNLSKLAFLAADVLLKGITSKSDKEENIAVVLSNKASSLDTDRRHQESITDLNNYFPSPAVFVYTLPNICIGEISIKHKLFSENSFFIFANFNAEHLFAYTNSLFLTNKANEVLCGWVEFDDQHYEAFLYLVSKEGTIQHTIEEITKLYQNKKTI